MSNIGVAVGRLCYYYLVKISKLKLFSLLGILIINSLIFYAVYQKSDSLLRVSFLDIGQGDAIFISSPSARQMLIDGGPDNSVLAELGKVMPFYDRSIDVVVATHPDQDHIAGLVSVLNRYSVGLFVHTGATSSSAVYRELMKIVEDKKIKEEIIDRPEDISLGGGADFEILFPDKDAAHWETNTSSIVGKLVYGKNSFLFTGDSPIAVEKYLVSKYGNLLDSDVYKAGHHGSKSSNSELFVGYVSPMYAVVSAGLNNKYGHPNKEVLDMFNKFKDNVLETMNGGMVRFQSDGIKVSLDI